MIYIVSASYGVKVGSSQDPERRLRVIRRLVPDAQLEYTVERGTYSEELQLEWAIHRALQKYHKHGEWFNCSVQEAIATIDATEGGAATPLTDAWAKRQISPSELLNLIADTDGGRIDTKRIKSLIFPRSLGNARRTLAGLGLVEPWTDVLVLTERGVEATESTQPSAPPSATPTPELAPVPPSENGAQARFAEYMD